MAKQRQKAVIKWFSKRVLLASIAPTPKNYKIRNDLGMERLRESLKSFGMAGNMTCNWAGRLGDIRKLVLIDGNSRREDAIEKKEKWVWVSLPNRVLTPHEFKEMSAMFDFAKAGDVDVERITQDLGSTKDFFHKYRMEVPMEKLAAMGKNAPAPEKGLSYPVADAAQEISDTRMVQLFFNEKQEQEVRKWEEKLKKKLKVDTITEVVYKLMKAAAK